MTAVATRAGLSVFDDFVIHTTLEGLYTENENRDVFFVLEFSYLSLSCPYFVEIALISVMKLILDVTFYNY